MTLKQRIRPGVCQFCGCTDAKGCVLHDSEPYGVVTCGWANRGRTVCSNPQCIRRAKKEGIAIQEGWATRSFRSPSRPNRAQRTNLTTRSAE